jgi:hypothetical protein
MNDSDRDRPELVQRRRRRRRGPAPALISGTSSEFLGGKPLPRAVRERPIVFLLGPRGVGKTSVANRLVEGGTLHLNERALLDAVSTRVRQRQWPDQLDTLPALILEGPSFLPHRPGMAGALKALVSARAESGLKTIITDAEGASALGMMEGIDPDLRATVVLRFPVGRGRLKLARHLCEELGIDTRYAERTVDLTPWSYAAVLALLRQMEA